MPPKRGSQTEAAADQDLVGRLAGLEKALIERLEHMTDMFKTELNIVVKRFEQSTKEILEDNMKLINELSEMKNELNENKKRIVQLETAVKNVQQNACANEQYSRRTNLIGLKQDDNENCNTVVHNFVTTTLAKPLAVGDIVRCASFAQCAEAGVACSKRQAC